MTPAHSHLSLDLCRSRSVSPETYFFEARLNFAPAFGLRGIPAFVRLRSRDGSRSQYMRHREKKLLMNRALVAPIGNRLYRRLITGVRPTLSAGSWSQYLRECERRLLPFFFALLATLSSGCSYFRTEMGRPLPAKSNEFAEGRTSVETVVHEMGPPNQATRLPDGFAFQYEYTRVTEFQLGISANVAFLRWFKFVKAWNRLNQEALVLTFDDQGLLRAAGLRTWDESLGGGSALQFLFAVLSLSDVSEILRPADAHSWGETLLQPLPVALNTEQSLRTGEHGLELRIAPNYAGQHTLEMYKPKTEKEKKRIKKNYQLQPK